MLSIQGKPLSIHRKTEPSCVQEKGSGIYTGETQTPPLTGEGVCYVYREEQIPTNTGRQTIQQVLLTKNRLTSRPN